MTEPLLDVEGLVIETAAADGDRTTLVDGVSLQVEVGGTLCLVGESGSGKSLTTLAVLGCLPTGVRQIAGSVRMAGRDLTTLPPRQLRGVQGREIGVVFQEPMSNLNPSFTIGSQLIETLRVHTGLTRAEARTRAVDLLDRVGIPEPARRLRAYPHQLSGGMAQRVMIALAISCDPDLLVADEPTTALDVTVQARILDLLRDLQTERQMGLLLVTHDLAVVDRMADHVAVMADGQLVEQGDVTTLLEAPTHDRTRALVEATRAVHGDEPLVTGAPDGPVLVDAVDVVKEYRLPGRQWQGRRPVRRKHTAVDGVSLTLREGETLGLVGESGAGKSTVGRLILGLDAPTSGTVSVDGTDLHRAGRRDRALRRDVQVVFQDPYRSLDPTMTVATTLAEPLEVHTDLDRAAIGDRVGELLAMVGLAPELAARRPDALSGGQRQRVAIARALALEPRLVVCDEPVSALDVSTQAQVVALLAELQRELGVAYLFISHDLAVVRQLSHTVAVMRHGRIVEQAPAGQLYDAPRHDYTRELLSASRLSKGERHGAPQ